MLSEAKHLGRVAAQSIPLTSFGATEMLTRLQVK